MRVDLQYWSFILCQCGHGMLDHDGSGQCLVCPIGYLDAVGAHSKCLSYEPGVAFADDPHGECTCGHRLYYHAGPQHDGECHACPLIDADGTRACSGYENPPC